jgi:hypothetical protein
MKAVGRLKTRIFEFRDRWRGFGAKGSGRLLIARPGARTARAGPLRACGAKGFRITDVGPGTWAAWTPKSKPMATADSWRGIWSVSARPP